MRHLPLPGNEPLLIFDTNFLRHIRSYRGEQLWLRYCGEVGIPANVNLIFPPTLVIEYAGIVPPRRLPRLDHLYSEVEGDISQWTLKCFAHCRKHYDNRRLTALMNQTFKAIKRKLGEHNRSKSSRETLRGARNYWRWQKPLIRKVLLRTLISNVLHSYKPPQQQRVDWHLKQLLWTLDLWLEGVPIPFLKVAQIQTERLRAIEVRAGRATTSPGWPDFTKISPIKPLDLGDSECISFAVLGYPIERERLSPVEVFTSDSKEKTIERVKMCKDAVTGLLELLREQGFGDRLKLSPAPGRIHFSTGRGFDTPITVASIR